jgi:hypothetical protein
VEALERLVALEHLAAVVRALERSAAAVEERQDGGWWRRQRRWRRRGEEQRERERGENEVGNFDLGLSP